MPSMKLSILRGQSLNFKILRVDCRIIRNLYDVKDEERRTILFRDGLGKVKREEDRRYVAFHLYSRMNYLDARATTDGRPSRVVDDAQAPGKPLLSPQQRTAHHLRQTDERPVKSVDGSVARRGAASQAGSKSGEGGN